jgi:hypothetical protein
MLATLFSVRAESRGIHIGTGTRFGLAGAFDRYLRLPFTLSDEELRSAFTTLQPLWHSLTEQKESFRLRKIILIKYRRAGASPSKTIIRDAYEMFL